MQRAVIIDAELELGVGNDDAARARVFGRLRIDRQRRVADLLRQIGADALLDFDVADVLVVLANRRLVGRREDRLRQLVGHLQTGRQRDARSEEHTSELQSLMRISYAVFCLKKKKKIK